MTVTRNYLLLYQIVLMTIDENINTTTKLSKFLDITHSNIVVIIKQLLKLKLVSSHKIQSDKRINIIKLTDNGKLFKKCVLVMDHIIRKNG